MVEQVFSIGKDTIHNYLLSDHGHSVSWILIKRKRGETRTSTPVLELTLLSWILNLYLHSLPCSLSSLHSTNDRSSNQISHYVMLIKWNVVTSIFVQRLSLDLSLSYGCGDTVTFDNSISLGHCSNSFMATNKGINYITSYRQSVLLRKETKLYSEIMNIINIVLKQNFNWNSSASFPSRQFQILHKPNYINFRIFDFLSQFSVPDLITCVLCPNTPQPRVSRVSRVSCVPTLLNHVCHVSPVSQHSSATCVT